MEKILWYLAGVNLFIALLPTISTLDIQYHDTHFVISHHKAFVFMAFICVVGVGLNYILQKLQIAPSKIIENINFFIFILFNSCVFLFFVAHGITEYPRRYYSVINFNFLDILHQFQSLFLWILLLFFFSQVIFCVEVIRKICLRYIL